jgi:uncharacterized protein
MAKDIIVISHANCADGFCAAWIAHTRFGEDADYLFANYGEPAPEVTGRRVYILDFSYPRDTLLKIGEQARVLALLDHHKTAEADLKGLSFAFFDMNHSGARLAWDFFMTSGPRPWLVDYVEDRDLWKWALPDSREISALIASYPNDFWEWDLLSGSDRFEMANHGHAILRYQARQIEANVAHCRRVELDGILSIPCINITDRTISESLHQLAEQNGSPPMALGWFQREDGQFVYSLRSIGELDVSEIAKRHGGGGHRNAAGFVSDKLLF